MRVVTALNSFKNCLGAKDVAVATRDAARNLEKASAKAIKKNREVKKYGETIRDCSGQSRI